MEHSKSIYIHRFPIVMEQQKAIKYLIWLAKFYF